MLQVQQEHRPYPFFIANIQPRRNGQNLKKQYVSTIKPISQFQ